MPSREDAVLVNGAAQGAIPLGDAERWFRALPDADQRIVIRWLGTLVAQAGGVAADVAMAAERAGVKPTATPCVLATRFDVGRAVGTMASLPSGELVRAFRLLICWLGVADSRRRDTRCADGCSHWWHRSL